MMNANYHGKGVCETHLSYYFVDNNRDASAWLSQGQNLEQKNSLSSESKLNNSQSILGQVKYKSFLLSFKAPINYRTKLLRNVSVSWRKKPTPAKSKSK